MAGRGAGGVELSKPTMFALRFEDDICEGKREVADSKLFAKGELVGLFATAGPGAELECLVYGPVTKIRSSLVLGGPGSWVEIHGEDRRLVMGRTGVNATYVGKASSAAEAILRAYNFRPDTQPTLIEHDTQKKQLTQSGTDLAFLEDIARRNNMEFWIEYEVTATGGATKLTEKARLRTSPDRSQTTGVPQLPTLEPGKSRALRVNPPAGNLSEHYQVRSPDRLRETDLGRGIHAERQRRQEGRGGYRQGRDAARSGQAGGDQGREARAGRTHGARRKKRFSPRKRPFSSGAGSSRSTARLRSSSWASWCARTRFWKSPTPAPLCPAAIRS